MKKLIPAALVAVLTACSGDPTDLKLSEVNEPENAKKLLETLSPDEREALQYFVALHSMDGDIDYKMTVKEAIKAYKAEEAQGKGLDDRFK